MARFKLTTRRTPLTETQIHIIDGLMLGDAHISIISTGKTPAFELVTVHKEYADFVQSGLPFAFNPMRIIPRRIQTIKGIAYLCQPAYRIRSKTDLSLHDIYARWYVGKHKIVPLDLVLERYSILHWFYCDGSTSCYKTEIRTRFATHGFSGDECDNLVNKLSAIDGSMDFKVISRTHHPLIQSSRIRTALALFDYLSPVAECSCFAYKFQLPTGNNFRSWNRRIVEDFRSRHKT